MECDRDVFSHNCYSIYIYIHAENIMREALEEWEKGISIGGRLVTNLRYADDTTLLAGTKEDLVELVERVRRASEKAGLYLNVGETKVMTTGDIGEVKVDGKDIEEITTFVFLGTLITKDGLCEKEVRRRIAMGKAAMGGLTSISSASHHSGRLSSRICLCPVMFFYTQ